MHEEWPLYTATDKFCQLQCNDICFFLKDDVIEYHIKNGKFPGDKIKLSKKPWMDVVVFIWVLLLVIPVCFAMVYLAYTGAWLTLGLIVLVLFVSKLVIHL